MKKKSLLWLLLCGVIMLGMPWASAFLKGGAGMAIILLEFFIAGPVLSLATGIYSGWDFRRRWWLPAANALLYLFGTWLFLEMGEPGFLLYTLCYLAIGVLAMLVTAILRKKFST